MIWWTSWSMPPMSRARFLISESEAGNSRSSRTSSQSLGSARGTMQLSYLDCLRRQCQFHSSDLAKAGDDAAHSARCAESCGLLRHVDHAQESLTVLTGLHQEAGAKASERCALDANR